MEPQKSSIGGVIGTIIILSLIILGGLYFWGKRIEESKAKQDLVADSIPEQATTEETTIVTELGESDDLDSIEAELNATNLDGLDSELNIEAE